jgi:hypothetical protein
MVAGSRTARRPAICKIAFGGSPENSTAQVKVSGTGTNNPVSVIS